MWVKRARNSIERDGGTILKRIHEDWRGSMGSFKERFGSRIHGGVRFTERFNEKFQGDCSRRFLVHWEVHNPVFLWATKRTFNLEEVCKEKLIGKGLKIWRFLGILSPMPTYGFIQVYRFKLPKLMRNSEDQSFPLEIQYTYQSTVVGGGDKAPMVIRTDWSEFEFFGSFWLYFEQKSVFKHF